MGYPSGGTSPLEELERASQAELERKYGPYFNACGDKRSFKRSFTRKLLQHLPDVLIDRENVLAMSSGVSGDGWCLIVLTDKRVLLLRKGVLSGLKQVAIEVEKISAVSGKVGLTMGVMSITAGPTTWQIYRLPKKAVMHFTNKVEEAIRGRRLGSEG